jgi:hypothetical protein
MKKERGIHGQSTNKGTVRVNGEGDKENVRRVKKSNDGFMVDLFCAPPLCALVIYVVVFSGVGGVEVCLRSNETV